MTTKEKKPATSLFEQGFSCAQVMLFTYGKNYFLEEASALKLASGFGAGISYRGEMCGAVSGAIMVIGLHFGYSTLTMEMQNEKTFKIINKFIRKFEEQNGSVICNRLLKTEINTSGGLDYARQNGLFKKICPDLIESASEILETLIRNEGEV